MRAVISHGFGAGFERRVLAAEDGPRGPSAGSADLRSDRVTRLAQAEEQAARRAMDLAQALSFGGAPSPRSQESSFGGASSPRSQAPSISGASSPRSQAPSFARGPSEASIPPQNRRMAEAAPVERASVTMDLARAEAERAEALRAQAARAETQRAEAQRAARQVEMQRAEAERAEMAREAEAMRAAQERERIVALERERDAQERVLAERALQARNLAERAARGAGPQVGAQAVVQSSAQSSARSGAEPAMRGLRAEPVMRAEPRGVRAEPMTLRAEPVAARAAKAEPSFGAQDKGGMLRKISGGLARLKEMKRGGKADALGAPQLAAGAQQAPIMAATMTASDAADEFVLKAAQVPPKRPAQGGKPAVMSLAEQAAAAAMARAQAQKHALQRGAQSSVQSSAQSSVQSGAQSGASRISEPPMMARQAAPTAPAPQPRQDQPRPVPVQAQNAHAQPAQRLAPARDALRAEPVAALRAEPVEKPVAVSRAAPVAPSRAEPAPRAEPLLAPKPALKSAPKAAEKPADPEAVPEARMSYAASKRRDPAPSRMAYRMQRLWLTPVFRVALRVGGPVFVSVLILGLWLGDDARRAALVERYETLKESIQERPEFMVSLLKIEGASPELDRAIRALMPVQLPASSFQIDLVALHEVITRFDVVKEAKLVIRDGGTLDVAITERQPAVLWRHSGGIEMLDAEGHRVATLLDRKARPDLPLIAGEGAEKAVPEALELLATAEPILPRARGLVRVGERRWDLVLDRNQRIQLPQDTPRAAVERLLAIDAAEDLMSRDFTRIDMRNQERPTIQLSSLALEEFRRMKGFETKVSQ